MRRGSGAVQGVGARLVRGTAFYPTIPAGSLA
jgi:hypothetical protein